MKTAILISVIIFNALSMSAQHIKEPFDKNVTLHIDHVIDNAPLILGKGNFVNSSNEPFTITTFNYFVSNISLKDISGKVYNVPQDESYFLQKATDSTTANMKFNVPQGTYQSISFIIGVDSLRSTMDISRRTGALDVSGGMLEGMYWTWNSGYIFLKMEGVSESAPLDRTGQKKFRYHIGGFGGYEKPSINNIRLVTLDLNEKGGLKVSEKSTNRIVIKADAAKVLSGKTNVSIAKNTQVMFGDFSGLIADNYSKMFSLVSVSK